MNPGDAILVRKRDGGREPFQVAKVRRGLAVAMRECQYDERFADSLARAVALHVEGWRDRHLPTTEYIFRCVRTVLKETGLVDVARQISLHRRCRAQRRRTVQVLDLRDRQRTARPWRKTDVARTFEIHHGLAPETSRILAAAVEERVLSLNYEVLTAALVDELVRSELLAWGLGHPDAFRDWCGTLPGPTQPGPLSEN